MGAWENDNYVSGIVIEEVMLIEWQNTSTPNFIFSPPLFVKLRQKSISLMTN